MRRDSLLVLDVVERGGGISSASREIDVVESRDNIREARPPYRAIKRLPDRHPLRWIRDM